MNTAYLIINHIVKYIKYILLKVDNFALVNIHMTGFCRSSTKLLLTELANSPHRVTLKFNLTLQNNINNLFI